MIVLARRMLKHYRISKCQAACESWSGLESLTGTLAWAVEFSADDAVQLCWVPAGDAQLSYDLGGRVPISLEITPQNVLGTPLLGVSASFTQPQTFQQVRQAAGTALQVCFHDILKCQNLPAAPSMGCA